jgi:hypothetical protein
MSPEANQGADQQALQALQENLPYTVVEVTKSGVHVTTFTPEEIQEAAEHAEQTPDD